MRLCSFHRPSITIIGHGDTIVLPKQSQRVTAEAELAVIIGRRCKDISVDEVPAVLLGVVFLIQTVLGIGAFVYTLVLAETIQPTAGNVFFITGHQTFGAVLLAITAFLILRVYRMRRN